MRRNPPPPSLRCRRVALYLIHHHSHRLHLYAVAVALYLTHHHSHHSHRPHLLSRRMLQARGCGCRRTSTVTSSPVPSALSRCCLISTPSLATKSPVRQPSAVVFWAVSPAFADVSVGLSGRRPTAVQLDNACGLSSCWPCSSDACWAVLAPRWHGMLGRVLGRSCSHWWNSSEVGPLERVKPPGVASGDVVPSASVEDGGESVVVSDGRVDGGPNV